MAKTPNVSPVEVGEAITVVRALVVTYNRREFHDLNRIIATALHHLGEKSKSEDMDMIQVAATAKRLAKYNQKG